MEVTKATLFTLKLTIEKRNEKSFAINTRENLSIKEKKNRTKLLFKLVSFKPRNKVNKYLSTRKHFISLEDVFLNDVH